MKTKVIRDAAGAIIHIGAWDYQVEPVFEPDLDKPIYRDDERKPIYEGVFRKRLVGYEQVLIGHVQKQVGERPTNHMPEGAHEDEADVIEGPDGGQYAIEDHRALRRAAYPDVRDQLDALFKAGVFPPEMAEQIAAVKARYPKSAA